MRAAEFEPSSFVVSKSMCEPTSVVSGHVREWIVPRFKKRSRGRRVFGLSLFGDVGVPNSHYSLRTDVISTLCSAGRCRRACRFWGRRMIRRSKMTARPLGPLIGLRGCRLGQLAGMGYHRCLGACSIVGVGNIPLCLCIRCRVECRGK
jgi:hypothetical protein